MTDRILIRDLAVSCIVGTNKDEREHKQNVSVNLAIEADLSAAGLSDRIEDTLDYRALKNRIVAHVERSECFLIERLAAEIADICLREPLAQAVTVTVDKPGALTRARSVAVDIRRARGTRNATNGRKASE